MLPFELSFVLSLIAAFLLSLILTPIVRFLSLRVGAVDKPNDRRINKTPMPSAGGLAVFFSFFLVAVGIFPKITRNIDMDIPYLGYILPVLVGATLVIITGYLDDIFEISAKKKMLGIIGGAVIIWACTDFRFDSFKIPFGGPMIEFGPVVTFVLTIIWIVSITNAINLIDGLDGLVAGVSMISLATMGMVSYFFLPQVDLFLTMTIFLLIAAILGFFPYNYHPAIIYGGDTGALFIGFMIGVLSLQGLKNSTAVAVVTPVIILGVPIVDTAVAIVRRKLSGRKISEADKMHLHHRLLAMGFTHRGAVLVVYGIAILFSLIALLLNISSRLGGILLMVGVLFALEVLIESLEIWGDNRTPLFNSLKFIGNSDYRQACLQKWNDRKK
ncbi:glycosyltransferase family 4 protein [Streptococcus pluranimalium]|uniref:glycosyltransferase family 4 protein n=1 Tax=Streptococcus pluranimalium TaxID=82348 RepID=UPI0039FBDBF1